MIIEIIKERLKNKALLKKWRILNEHNFTFLALIPRDEAIFNQLTIGHFTYGPIWAAWSGNPDESLSVGSYCSIGSGTKFILGSEHPYNYLSTFPFKVKCAGYSYEATTKGPIVVKDDVWIGEDSLILSGVTIGQGAVVAARSVVVKDIPPYSIVGGNPAKVIKERFDKNIIDKLCKFNYDHIKKSLGQEDIQILYTKINNDNIDSILNWMSSE